MRVDNTDISFSCCRSSIILRKVVINASIPFGSGPCQLNQLSELAVLLMGKLCMTSESNKCGNFWRVHWVNNFKRVWMSCIPLLSRCNELFTASTCSS